MLKTKTGCNFKALRFSYKSLKQYSKKEKVVLKTKQNIVKFINNYDILDFTSFAILKRKWPKICSVNLYVDKNVQGI